MALTQQQREALPSEHFAVPGKRRLPINDERHTKLAWDMVDRTKGLSDEEKAEARRRIKRRAGELGIDTSKWSVHAEIEHEDTLRLAAMSLDLPHVDDHPNRMPFSGILMRLDQPSDAPPSGSGGKRTIMSAETARAMIPSLLGMPVDFRPDFAGHNPQQKIGTIMGADVDGDALTIHGFFYPADFPQECDFIQAEKADLGFSYEIRAKTQVEGDLLHIVGGSFTGAAVLFKAKAAYHSTKLAATAEREFDTMTKEELQAILAEALKPLGTMGTQITELAAKVAKIEAKPADDLKANAEMRAKVQTHSNALRSCAAAMEAAGIGLHATNGHVGMLNRMAASMDAEAASGKLPHIYRDHDWGLGANADMAALLTAALAGKKPGETGETDQAKLLSAAIAEAIKPLTEKLDAAETTLKDLKAKGFSETRPPERKTLDAEGTLLLAKANIKPDATTGKVGVRQLDAACKSANLSNTDSLALKLSLTNSGMLDNAA